MLACLHSRGPPSKLDFRLFIFLQHLDFQLCVASSVFKGEKFSQNVMKHCNISSLKPRTTVEVFQLGCKVASAISCSHLSSQGDIIATELGFCSGKQQQQQNNNSNKTNESKEEVKEIISLFLYLLSPPLSFG